MSNYFDELVRELAKYQLAVDPAYLHGLLTGYATVPAMDAENLFREVAGEQPLAESVIEAVFDSIESIAEDLSTLEFQARFDSNRQSDAKRWLDGYFRAVEIHEQDWEDLSESHLKAGASLMMLHTMVDEELHRDLKMKLPGPKELKQNPQLITDLVSNIFNEFQGDTESDFLSPNDNLSSLHIPKAVLATMDEAALMALVTSSDDVLPLEVVTECASRQDAMVALLQQHLVNDAHWNDDVDESDRWGLLHAVFILGLIPGEASAKALLDAFRRITIDEYNDLGDWLSSNWPALFRNKRKFTTTQLQQIAQDPSLRWYARCAAIGCVLADAAEQDPAALDKAIDWLAAMCSDAVEDPEFRVIAGQYLLDFPRERHREVMYELVDLQSPGSVVDYAYTRDDIQISFNGPDCPEWESFDNPWQFYDSDEIERRQMSWLTDDDDIESDPDDYISYGSSQPFLREEPKIGRNDPCHCGSGKKYKKCCLKSRP